MAEGGIPESEQQPQQEFRRELFERPLSEAQQKAMELDYRLPAFVSRGSQDADMYFGLGFRERQKSDEIVKRFADHIEQVNPAAFASFEKLAMAVANSFDSSSAPNREDFTKLVSESATAIQDVADKSGGRIGVDEIPKVVSEADRQNRELLMAASLTNLEVVNGFEEVLTPRPPEENRFGRTAEGWNPVEHYKNNALGIGKRAAWALVKAYKTASDLSSRFSDEQSAQVLKDAVVDYSRRNGWY